MCFVSTHWIYLLWKLTTRLLVRRPAAKRRKETFWLNYYSVAKVGLFRDETCVTRLCVTGQAVSASSHPRRAWPGEGGRDRPGSAGSSSFEARTAVGHVTTPNELTPHGITGDLRTLPTPPRVRTRWSVGLCCSCLTETRDGRMEKHFSLFIWRQLLLSLCPSLSARILFVAASSRFCARACVCVCECVDL